MPPPSIQPHIRADGVTTYRVRVPTPKGRKWIEVGEDAVRAEEIGLGVWNRVTAGFRLEEAMAWADEELAKPVARLSSSIATIGELIKARDGAWAVLGINPVSARVAELRLLRIVEAVILARKGSPYQNHYNGGRRRVTAADYLSASRKLSILTPDLVKDYRKIKFRDLVPGTREHAAATLSFASELQSLRDLFSGNSLKFYGVKGLVIPELREFMKAALQPKVERPLFCPPLDFVPAAHAAVASMQGEAAIAATLSLRAGLTIAEMKSACRLLGNRLQLGDRMVQLTPQVTSLIVGRTTPLFGTAYEQDMAVRRANRVLRACGLKGISQLRDLYTWFVLSRYSLAAVPSLLGHRSLSTTERFQSWPDLPADLVALWDDTDPALAAA